MARSANSPKLGKTSGLSGISKANRQMDNNDGIRGRKTATATTTMSGFNFKPGNKKWGTMPNVNPASGTKVQ